MRRMIWTLFKVTLFNLILVSSMAVGSVYAETELKMWVAGEPGTTVVYDTLAKVYMQKNPDVKIVVTKVGSDLFNPTLVPALSAGQGPDIFMYGTGPGQPAALIKSGLVKDLTPYYHKYDWGKVIPESIENVLSSNGKLWAVGNEVETTAMFYNKKVFQELNLSVPRTWSEFENVVKALQAGGYKTPIGLGGADKWPISHWQSMMFGRYANPTGIEDVLFRDGKWVGAAFVEASQRLQTMAKEEYFGPNPVANGYAETMDAFWSGKVPMTFTGPWIIEGATKTLGEKISDFGVFQIPPFAAGQKIYPTEDIGSGFYISDHTQHPDIAADVLNHFFFHKESRLTLLNNGTIPVGPLEEILPESQLPKLTSEIRSLIEADRSNGTIHAFLDTVSPKNITNASYDGLQALLLNVMSPQEFVESLQVEWEIAKKKNAILLPGGVAK